MVDVPVHILLVGAGDNVVVALPIEMLKAVGVFVNIFAHVGEIVVPTGF